MPIFTYEGGQGTSTPSAELTDKDKTFVAPARLGVIQNAEDLAAHFHLDSGSTAEMFRLENDTGKFQFNVSSASTIELKNVD